MTALRPRHALTPGLALALALGLAAPPAPAQAQEQPAATEAPDAGPQPGQTYLRAAHGDWEQRCIAEAPNAQSDAQADVQADVQADAQAGRPPERCQLYQLLRDETGNAVAEVMLFALAAPQGPAVAGATIIVPLETLLTEELRMVVDDGAIRTYPFALCTAMGCIARIGLTAAEVDEFRAGNAATLAIVPAAAPDQTVMLTLSLRGFTAGYRALEAELAR